MVPRLLILFYEDSGTAARYYLCSSIVVVDFKRAMEATGRNAGLSDSAMPALNVTIY